MKLTGRAGHSREKWQKIARKITENRPDFCPGCCAGAVAAVGLPSPAFPYPRRLALCGRLCAPLWGVLAAGSIGIAPPPGAALWGVYGRFRRYCSRGCGLLAPVRRCGRLCGLFRGLPVSLYPCPVAWLCAPSVAAVSTCAPLSRGCGSCALSIVPAWPVGGCGGTEKKPGQAVQAPPGRKRTAAGIAPGAALWFYLFIFNNSDRIANGIIKSTKRTNIFDFHPLYYAALYCLYVGVSCTSRRISFIAAFMAALVSFSVLYPVHHPGEY